MKTTFIMVVMLVSSLAAAQTLPVITSSPTNITVNPGNTATFTVAATGATSYQWLCNGTNIAGATGATLQVANAQSTNCGYYLAIAKNPAGWVPSQMAYLTLDYTYSGSQPTACGTLPLSNTNDTYSAGDIELITSGTPNNGTVQMFAGPELDQMRPVGQLVHYRTTPASNRFYNGYYNAPDQSDSTALPGQPIYYWIIANYTNSGAWIQPSAIMRLTAGTNGLPAPSCYGLKFPLFDASSLAAPLSGLPFYDPSLYVANTNELCVTGETFSFTNSYSAYTDYGMPTAQWRKNGIPVATGNNSFVLSGPGYGYGTCVLTIANVQASDSGIYDFIVYGNIWTVSPKITLSVQITGGQGIFQQPRLSGTNFVCSLVGAAGRNYQVQWSTNLTSWSNLTTLSNVSGTVTFTNPPPSTGQQFYRTVLLP